MNKRLWDKAAVINDAAKYNSVAEWRQSSASAYAVCCRNKWNDEACAHMARSKQANGYWTDEKIIEESKKYESTAQWNKEGPSSYQAAKKRKLVPPEMKRRLEHGKWTKANIAKVAKECSTRGEFRSTHASAYTIALNNGWLDDVCKHMLNKAPWFGPRVIREYLMSHDVSFKLEHKFKQHKKVAKYPFDFFLQDFNLVIEYHGRQHKDGWLNDKEDAAAIQSRDQIKKDFAVANNLNYLELNQTNKKELFKALESELVRLADKESLIFSLTARSLTEDELKSLETAFVWNYESVKAAVAKCKSVKEFRETYPGGHGYSLLNGIWEELSKPLKRVTEHGKYTKVYVAAAALECTTRNEFKQRHRGAWAAAQRNAWLVEVCSHMPKHTQKPWLG